MRGIIALDIDGTITADSHQIPQEVIDYLAALEKAGWSFLFITGRTYAYGMVVLNAIPFPYTYTCYNGAISLQMPEALIVKRHYILAKLIPNLVAICQSVGFDPLIHTGVEFGDYCYFRPDQVDKETREYLEKRRTLTSEPWVAIQEFAPLKLKEFAYAKVFGPKEAMIKIQLSAHDLGLTATVIRDPLRPGYGGVVITEGGANKGGGLRDHRRRVEKGLVAIAAGDDMNDLSLLEEADIAIAMGGAPDPLLAVADIKAPWADKLGIIEGLKEALK